jgi:hypothetical protein
MRWRTLSQPLTELWLDMRELRPSRLSGSTSEDGPQGAGKSVSPTAWKFLWIFPLLLVPIAAVLEFVFGLWADAGEVEGDIAIWTLALALSVGGGAFLALVVSSASANGRQWCWPALTFVSLPFAAYLYFFYAVDSPAAHWIALAMPLSLVHVARRRVGARVPAARVAVAIVVALVAIRAYTAWPEARLARYSQQLVTGCWCCDMKTRAIHELAKMGPNGLEAIERLSGAEGVGRGQVASCLRSEHVGAATKLVAWLEAHETEGDRRNSVTRPAPHSFLTGDSGQAVIPSP